MKSFCLLIILTFAKAFSKMKQFKITEYKDDLHRRRKNNSGHDMVCLWT